MQTIKTQKKIKNQNRPTTSEDWISNLKAYHKEKFLPTQLHDWILANIKLEIIVILHKLF